jgi:hypothetical protein
VNILLLASHAVAEYDDLRMFADLGYDVFVPGGYERPAQPTEPIRPALPNAPDHPDLAAACHAKRHEHAVAGDDTSWAIDWAKADIPDDVLDWADTIIIHHFPERWIAGQWDRIKHKRVIWRTCGQSVPEVEEYMRVFTQKGLAVVRYSPMERLGFGQWGSFAGQDAVIRFGKYPDDWYGWTGERLVVGNVTQDLEKRGEAVGYHHWQRLTAGLPAQPAGAGSEEIGGLGPLSYDGLRAYLRSIRVYLYTGTVPASYTLALIEAMMTGTPVVCISRFDFGPAAPLFEAPSLVTILGDPRAQLEDFLRNPEWAAVVSGHTRTAAIREFGIVRIGQQWREFLGSPSRPDSAAVVPS